MSHFTHARGRLFRRSSLSETIAELGLAAAAAALTAVIWLSVAGWALVPVSPAAAAVASRPVDARHVTLPKVVIVGRRDSLHGTPATTTAQNTAANPITLR